MQAPLGCNGSHTFQPSFYTVIKTNYILHCLYLCFVGVLSCALLPLSSAQVVRQDIAPSTTIPPTHLMLRLHIVCHHPGHICTLQLLLRHGVHASARLAGQVNVLAKPLCERFIVINAPARPTSCVAEQLFVPG